MIVFAGLAVAVVGGSLLWWTLLHRPYTYHSVSSSGGNITWGNVTWSLDGKFIAFTTSSDLGQNQSTSTLRVWEVNTNENLSIYSSSSSSVGYRVFWSPNSKYLAFTTATNPGGSSTNTVQMSTAQVWIWDAITKAKVSIYTFTYPGSPYANINMDWSPDSKHLAFTTAADSGGSSTNTVQTSTVQVWVWDVITKAKVSIYTSTGSFTYDYVSSYGNAEITWSPDGKYLAFKTYTVPGGSPTYTVQKGTVQVRVWDAITKANLFIYTYPYTATGSYSYETYFGSSVPYFGSGTPSYSDITWSTDNKHLAFVINRIDPGCESTSNSCNGTVHIWDATTKSSTYVLHLSSSAVDIIAWSPDNASIASGNTDGTLYVWYAV